MSEPKQLSPKDYEDPSSSMTVYVAVVGGILVFVIVVWLQAIFNHTLHQEQYEKQIMQKPVEREQYRAEQKTRLNSYGWVNQEAGVTHIPIERAMELMVREQG